MSLSRDLILALFRETGALLEGHFQLTSGLHSPQYFQCAKVLQYPQNAELLCGEIVEHYGRSPIDTVIAPALGGIVVGQEVGRQIAIRGIPVRTMFTERKDDTMMLRRGFEIHRNENILVCEDVITTGGSVGEVIDIVRAAGASVAGVACIVDRSGGKVRFKVPQHAVLEMDVVVYQPADCPLCRKDIPIDKPGSRGS